MSTTLIATTPTGLRPWAFRLLLRMAWPLGAVLSAAVWFALARLLLAWSHR